MVMEEEKHEASIMLLQEAKSATKKRIKKGGENLGVNLATRKKGITINATPGTMVVNSPKSETYRSILKQSTMGGLFQKQERVQL